MNCKEIRKITKENLLSNILENLEKSINSQTYMSYPNSQCLLWDQRVIKCHFKGKSQTEHSVLISTSF